MAEIRARYGERFIVGALSMQGVILRNDQLEEAFLPYVLDRFSLAFNKKPAVPEDWTAWPRVPHG